MSDPGTEQVSLHWPALAYTGWSKGVEDGGGNEGMFGWREGWASWVDIDWPHQHTPDPNPRLPAYWDAQICDSDFENFSLCSPEMLEIELEKPVLYLSIMALPHLPHPLHPPV